MGILYRDGKYLKYVVCGKRTVKDGEALAVWNRSGRHREIVGPKLEYLWCSTIRFLDKHTANQHQYLRVELVDGSVEHVAGPKTIFENPVKHRLVTVLPVIELRSQKECVVLYKVNAVGTRKQQQQQQPDTHADRKGSGTPTSQDSHASNSESPTLSLERSVVYGPLMYVPSVNERVHHFHWRFGDDQRPLKGWENHDLVTVKTHTAQAYSFTAELITSDNISAHVTVNCYISVDDVQKLADGASDPIDYVFRAYAADVLDLGRQMGSADLRETAHTVFSDMKSFSRLLNHAGALGMTVRNVDYSGLTASSELKNLYDHRAQIESDYKREVGASELRSRLEDMDLHSKKTKLEETHSHEKNVQELQNKLKLLEQDFQLELGNREEQTRLKMERDIFQQRARLETEKLEHEQQMQRSRFVAEGEGRRMIATEYVELLTAISGLGVDMTKFLCKEKDRNELIRFYNKKDLDTGDKSNDNSTLAL